MPKITYDPSKTPDTVKSSTQRFNGTGLITLYEGDNYVDALTLMQLEQFVTFTSGVGVWFIVDRNAEQPQEDQTEQEKEDASESIDESEDISSDLEDELDTEELEEDDF